MSQVGGHTLRPAGAPAGRRAPLWVSLRCGLCGIGFEANAHSVPSFEGRTPCRGCMRRINLVRRQANEAEWDVPEDAYPECDPDQLREEIVPVQHPLFTKLLGGLR